MLCCPRCIKRLQSATSVYIPDLEALCCMTYKFRLTSHVCKKAKGSCGRGCKAKSESILYQFFLLEEPCNLLFCAFLFSMSHAMNHGSPLSILYNCSYMLHPKTCSQLGLTGQVPLRPGL